jgi:putative membrane protein
MRWPGAVAWAILAATWLGPLPALSRHSFAAHMTLHMLVVAVAAPLLALGLAGGRFDPLRWRPRFFSPVPASIVELVVVWTWHAPALHHAARSDVLIFSIEQATFLAAGLLLWFSVLGAGTLRTANRAGAGIVALLLTSMHMTLLGALLALSPRPLYGHAVAAGTLSAIDDQQLGGAIMLVVGGVVYLLGGVALTIALFRRASMVRT